MSLRQEQLNRFFQIMAESKLNSELEELVSGLTDSHWFAVNTGTDDAKKAKPSLVRGVLGDYNADTNTPSLTNATGVGGDSYRVSVAGTHDFGSGAIEMAVDDVIEFRGVWRKRNAIKKVESKLISLGNTGNDSIIDYINANDSLDWDLKENSVTIFTLIKGGIKESHLFVGTLPKYLGVSNEAALVSDFKLIHSGRIYAEDCEIVKTGTNADETQIEDGDIVWFKDVDFQGITVTLMGHSYNGSGADKLLKTSYTKAKSIA